MRAYIFIAFVLAVSAANAAQPPQSTRLLKQQRDGVPAKVLPASERALLGDPFFNLVLKDHANVTNLAEIEKLIQPDASKRQVFVVDENIANSERGQTRRSVLTFTGSNRGEVLSPNVMLSVFFDSERFMDEPTAIEALGWDNRRGRYNYYKLDQTGTPELRPTWKFRGSSEKADLLTASERKGTCMACHINGAPVMKELEFPWNNWHSSISQATYLTQAGNPSARWPVADSLRLKDRLKTAEDLEVDGILPAITQFNVRRINSSLARRDSDGNIAVDAEGFSTVVDAQRLLRPLFVTTEFNITSSHQKSGLHPFPAISTTGPAEPIVIPNTFFLNANLIGGGTRADYVGLGIKKTFAFSEIARLKPSEYKRLVVESAVQLGGRKPGDADFAWFVPEPSHMDNDLVDALMKRGIVTPQFVAAVMSIDLENPILSGDRESLLGFVPETFRFKALAAGAHPLMQKRHPDDLTRQVIAALERSRPPAGSVADTFMKLLKESDPLKQLENRVDMYHARLKKAFDTSSRRRAELKRLYQIAVERRQAVLRHETLGAINETGDRLFPVP